jgi:hypothetical protein
MQAANVEAEVVTKDVVPAAKISSGSNSMLATCK